MFKPRGAKGYIYGRGVPPPGDRFWIKNTGKIPELDHAGFDADADRKDEMAELSWAWISSHAMHGQFGG